MPASPVRPAARSAGSSVSFRSPSPFASVQIAFRSLVTGPMPLSVPERLLDPQARCRGRVPLDRVQQLLVPRARRREEIAARVWPFVVPLAQDPERPEWAIAAVGLALPTLRAQVARMGQRGKLRGVEREDLEQEVLAAFLAALRRVRVNYPDPFGFLRRAADNAAQKHARLKEACRCRRAPFDDRVPIPRPEPRHEVLARAVKLGTMTAYEAELIAVVRVDGLPLTAMFRGRPPAELRAAQRARQAAELRLVAAINAGQFEGLRRRVERAVVSEGGNVHS